MYTRFKKWVNDAYREILLKREETFLRSERTVSVISPRVVLNNVATPILVGDELQALDSGVRFLVTKVFIDPLNPDVRTEIDFTYIDTPPMNFIMGETVQRVTPNPQNPIAKVEYLPGWDLRVNANWIREIDRTSMLVQNLTDGLQDGRPGYAEFILPFVWDQWLNYVTYSADAASTPRYVAEGPDGKLYFWPRPDKPYSLMYTYSRGITDLVDYDDVPWPIPEDLQLIIVWKAIMEYAQYDQKDRTFLRARDKYRFYNNKLEETLLPDVNVGPFLFWADGGTTIHG